MLRGNEGAILFQNDPRPFLCHDNPFTVFVIGKIKIDDIASFNTNRRRCSARAVEDNIGEVSCVGMLV
jgi:hypothetical protein